MVEIVILLVRRTNTTIFLIEDEMLSFAVVFLGQLY